MGETRRWSGAWGVLACLLASCTFITESEHNNRLDGVDLDGDGFIKAEDCNDRDAAIHPEADEICDTDGVDEDCDGLINEADPGLVDGGFPDFDGDGFGAQGSTRICSAEAVAEDTDCDDGNQVVNPGVDEVCDALLLDENCNGLINGSDPTLVSPLRRFVDGDRDGYGAGTTESDRVPTCENEEGFADVGGDCDDLDSSVHPNALETCNYGGDDCDAGTELCWLDVMQDVPIRLQGSVASGAAGQSVAVGRVLPGETNPQLIVGAPAADLGRGVVYVVPTPLSPSTDTLTYSDFPSGTIELWGESEDEGFGETLAVVSDGNAVDDDELLVGAPNPDGRVFVFDGGFPALHGDATYAFGSLVPGPGGSRFGRSTGTGLSLLSEANTYVAIGSIYTAASQDYGRVFVYDWAAWMADPGSETPTILTASTSDSNAGSFVAVGFLRSGFLNSDLAIGAPDDLAGDGTVSVVGGPFGDGNIENIDWVQIRGTAGGRLGVHGAVADLNGDLLDDLIVSAPATSAGAGEINVLYGPFDSGTKTVEELSKVVIASDQPDAGLGPLAVGDLNQDGENDLIVGAPGYMGRGAVFLFLTNGAALFSGDQTLNVTDASRGLLGTEGSQLGAWVGVAPSLDGDAAPDLVFTAPRGGTDGVGTVHVLQGSASL